MQAGKQILITFLLFFTLDCFGQTKSGLIGEWEGKLKDSSGEFDYSLKLEREDLGVYSGVSTSRSANFYCATKVKAFEKNGLLIVSEIEVLNTNFPDKQALCLLKLDLTIVNSRLSGDFAPLNNTANCLSGTVSLIKKSSVQAKAKVENSQQSVKITNSTPTKLKESTAGLNPPAALKIDTPGVQAGAVPRVENKLRSIEVDEDEAELIILDNMAVDGDIITLIDNDNIIFRRVTLTKLPLSYKINNKTSSVHLIKFHAENLGDTPPNTGVLLVKTSKSVIKTDFTSDLSNTSTIQINLKKAL